MGGGVRGEFNWVEFKCPLTDLTEVQSVSPLNL